MPKGKILLDGYSDHNLGDDLMMHIAAGALTDYDIYSPHKSAVSGNVGLSDKKSGFDAYLKVIGSGFLIYNNLGVLYRLRETLEEKRYSPFKAVIGCSISGFINGAARAAVNHQLRGYDLITVRDEYSYDYVRSNAPEVPCFAYPDIVLSMPDDLVPACESDGRIGIAVRNGIDAGVMAKTADGYVKETGNKVTLLCFDGGAEDDLKAALGILDSAKYKEKITVAVYSDIPSMLVEIKKCGLIIGIRLHSIILAARMGIPFVPVAYSDKTRRALDMMGYDGEIYDAAKLDAHELLRAGMNVKPFALSKSVIEAAGNHILRFKSLMDDRAGG